MKFKDTEYDLANADFATILTTQSGEPLANRNFGIKLALDPYTLYRNLPDQHTASFTIDSRGFRADTTDSMKPNTIVLGGSAAFGQGLRRGEVPFAALIDNEFDEFIVANGAVIGYVSGQELAAMVHYLDDFTPDLYIVFDGWNDLFGPFARIRSWPAPAIQIGMPATFFEIESRLLTARRTTQTNPRSRNEMRIQAASSMDEKAFFDGITNNYLKNLEKMADFCRARGAGLVVVFQPELGHKENPSFTELGQLEYWDRTYSYLERGFPAMYENLVATAAKRCNELGIPSLNMLENATINRSKETVFLDAVHLNQLGHAMVAHDIIQILRE